MRGSASLHASWCVDRADRVTMMFRFYSCVSPANVCLDNVSILQFVPSVDRSFTRPSRTSVALDEHAGDLVLLNLLDTPAGEGCRTHFRSKRDSTKRIRSSFVQCLRLVGIFRPRHRHRVDSVSHCDVAVARRRSQPHPLLDRISHQKTLRLNHIHSHIHDVTKF
jgi:hypothetical protein